MLSGKLPGLISILHIYYNHEAQRADFLCAAPLDSERPYCPDCFHSLSDDRPIHDYYYKPDPIFYGEGPRYFGVELGYLSHRTAICGLHVYISRSAFGLDEATQDRAIARVLYFFEKHWEELLKFSRCTPRPLRLYGAALRILDYAKKGDHGGRYTCVNLQAGTRWRSACSGAPSNPTPFWPPWSCWIASVTWPCVSPMRSGNPILQKSDAAR